MDAARPSSVFRPPLFRLPAAVILGCVLALAASAQPAPQPGVSEKLAAELGKLRDFTEARSFAPALVLIDRLLAASSPDSYDFTLLSQIKAQIFLNEARYADAIPPLEAALANGERLGHLPASQLADTCFLLAQLHQQQGTEAKDPARRRALLDKSADLLARWQSRIQKPTTEGRLFAASLHYQRATLDPDRLDTDALAASLRAAEEGLLLQTRPPASLYVLILAALQQRQDHAGAADFLEILVEKNPANAAYWQQLAGTYLALAAAAPGEREAARLNLRALLAIERAQARGHLASPKDNFNRVALYLALRQFDPAISLLEKGLADGTLDNTRRNWELLANSYQQTRRAPQAVAALEKSVKALPSDGQLEFALAQLHYAAGRLPETRDRLERAVAKGSLEKPGQARLFLAYVAYEQKDTEAAARWVKDAAAFDDVKKEDLARLSKAIDEARARPVPAT